MSLSLPIRRHGVADCDGTALAYSLDSGDRCVGLLIVSGGNEPRNGAFNAASLRASRIAQSGFPVLRFDRRGVGDSEGANHSYPSSQKDIAAATATLKRLCPHLRSVIAYGNCDGATALVLHSLGHFDGLVLSNPWAFDRDTGARVHSPQELRSRYGRKLTQPREWQRLLRGTISFTKLAAGLRQALRPPRPSSLAESIANRLRNYAGPTHILLAEKDRTGAHFLSQLADLEALPTTSVTVCSGADHAFSAPEHQIWLEERLLRALFHEETRQLNMGGPTELADRA